MRKILILSFILILFQLNAQHTDVYITPLDSIKKTDTTIYSVFTEDVKFNNSSVLKSFIDFADQHFIYKTVFFKDKVQGKCFIEFVIEKNGDLTHFKILKSLSDNLDNEFLRILKMSAGKWNCGKIYGVKARSKMVIPFMFKLPEKFSKANYLGQIDFFYPFFISHFNYPYQKYTPVNDKIKLKAVVYKDSTIKITSLPQTTYEPLKTEIIRVLELTKWKPAMANEQNVNSEIELTVSIYSNLMFPKRTFVQIELRN